MVRHCTFCKRRIWPWQRAEFFVITTRRAAFWHPQCAYMTFRHWMG
jgi:hypothetical protein